MSVDHIKKTIEAAVDQATVYVADPQADGQHYEALVISPAFEGQPLVRQHQMVMNALKQEFEGAVHALALKTFTPQQWEESKGQFNV